MKTIRFDNTRTGYTCSAGSGQSGEYYRADDVREAMAVLVEACRETSAYLERTMNKSNRKEQIIGKLNRALAALPSPPQAN